MKKTLRGGLLLCLYLCAWALGGVILLPLNYKAGLHFFQLVDNIIDIMNIINNSLADNFLISAFFIRGRNTNGIPKI